MESMQIMEGIFDIYMPDFKYWSKDRSQKYLNAKNYPKATRTVIKEMHRQVGDLALNENGLAKYVVLLRHLVMPDELEDAENIMDHYFPSGQVSEKKYQEINRCPHSNEFETVEKNCPPKGPTAV
jgi:putative pyruvate formate lyase activating enzyme